MPDRGRATASAAEAEADLIAQYRITRVPADRYEVDGYRYGSLADAVAQAKRTRQARP
jgi:hypothetical protein